MSDPAAQADRMWERLFEFALFIRSGHVHSKSTEILKAFLKPTSVHQKLSKQEKNALSRAFIFLRDAYKTTTLGESRFATDQTHFYTMVTTLLASDLIDRIDHDELARKLSEFGERIGAKRQTSDKEIQEYLELSSRQTTDAEKRKQRQALFERIVNRL